jgi:ribosomal protein S18 acetylase RimI-like enzyme
MGNWEESMLLDQSEELGEELLLNPPSISDSARQLKDLVESIDIENQKFKDFVSKRAIELAYILGYLTPDYYRNCRAWVLWDKDHQEIQSLLFEYNGLSLATLWSYGSALHIEAMINALSKELPRRVQFNMEDHHLQSIRTLYAVKHRKPTLRMGLDRDHYQPTGNTDQVEVLSHKDTGAIMRLYHQYPDHLFEPAQLDTGLYCGIKVEQELISVAGIHLLSENYNVAAIGNIVTDEKYRGKGLASKCVRHVLDDLFKKIERVALNVQEGNYPAISCYQKFGFRTVSRLIEAQGKLR